MKNEIDRKSKAIRADYYLPSGKGYQSMVGSKAAENPRKDTSIPRWLHEWEQKWKQNTGDGNKDDR